MNDSTVVSSIGITKINPSSFVRMDVNDIKNTNNDVNAPNRTIKKPVYRFKLSEEITQHLIYFARIHKHDDRVTFKDAWNEWIKNNESLTQNETRRLFEMGYMGNVMKKMYVSVRYYYKNKSNKTESETTQKKRRQYIKLDNTILQLMDTHIRENNMQLDYTPAKGFKNFIEENYYTIDREITRLITNSSLKRDDVNLKLKKTYKNRYYIFTTK